MTTATTYLAAFGLTKGPLTYARFLRVWSSTVDRAQSQGLRAGQHAFNLLAELRPDISEKLRTVWPIDPYYRDDHLPRFWIEVQARW